MSLPMPWEEIQLPSAVNQIKSMLSPEEKQYLTWLASKKYEGWGAIVELGVWLGSSSAALAEGLRRRGSAARIHSFDLFMWEDYMAAATSEDLKKGDDFMPVFLREIGDYHRWIEPKKVDLLKYSWTGGPIEMLFVDSAKDWELANAVLRGFGSHLEPGRSRVILQDFRFHYAHCLPLIFDSRPDLWKQVENVHGSATVTFIPLKPINSSSNIPVYCEESFPLAAADKILRDRIAREEGLDRTRMLQTLCRKYLIDGPLDEALKLREQVIADGMDPKELAILEDIGGILQSRGWKAMERGDFATARASAERCLAVPGATSVYAWTLLGFALVKLGENEGAKHALDQILTMDPQSSSGALLGVELALSERRYRDAATGAMRVLATASETSIVNWANSLLSRARRQN